MNTKFFMSLALVAGLGLAAWAARPSEQKPQPKPEIPAHDCCHNGKCCGTPDCCDTTGCKSAKCPSIKKK